MLGLYVLTYGLAKIQTTSIEFKWVMGGYAQRSVWGITTRNEVKGNIACDNCKRAGGCIGTTDYWSKSYATEQKIWWQWEVESSFETFTSHGKHWDTRPKVQEMKKEQLWGDERRPMQDVNVGREGLCRCWTRTVTEDTDRGYITA